MKFAKTLLKWVVQCCSRLLRDPATSAFAADPLGLVILGLSHGALFEEAADRDDREHDERENGDGENDNHEADGENADYGHGMDPKTTRSNVGAASINECSVLRLNSKLAVAAHVWLATVVGLRAASLQLLLLSALRHSNKYSQYLSTSGRESRIRRAEQCA